MPPPSTTDDPPPSTRAAVRISNFFRFARASMLAPMTTTEHGFWALGDYDRIAELVADLGTEVVAAADVGPGMRVLDVGAGSGWTTALLAELVGPSGSVLGVEIAPRLAAWGAANLAAMQFPWASIVEASPGVLGLPESAPYDRILVSADASAMPVALLDQLADPGRLVAPVRSRMTLVVQRDGEREISHHGSYRFVPLL